MQQAALYIYNRLNQEHILDKAFSRYFTFKLLSNSHWTNFKADTVCTYQNVFYGCVHDQPTLINQVIKYIWNKKSRIAGTASRIHFQLFISSQDFYFYKIALIFFVSQMFWTFSSHHGSQFGGRHSRYSRFHAQTEIPEPPLFCIWAPW